MNVPSISKKHIRFDQTGHTGKTAVWSVIAHEGNADLGTVKWFGRWRRYAFFPAPATVFEKDCLRDLADFCDEITKEHRSSLAARLTEQ